MRAKNWIGLTATAAVCVSALPAYGADAAEADRLFREGRWEAAENAYSELAYESPDDQQAWYRLGYARHAQGRIEEALEAHVRAVELGGPATAAAAFNAACAASLLGREKAACDWLAQAVAAGFSSCVTLDTDPDLRAVRSSPEFLALREQLARRTLYRSTLGAPEPGHADQFDFWIGAWETVNHAPAAGGARPAGKLVSRVVEVLGGHALVEWSEATAPGGPQLGFSLRTYDADRDEWAVLLNWPSPGDPSFSFLSGRFHHGRCELFTPLHGPGGAKQTRFTFSDTGPDRYRWDSATTSDGGASWATTLVFEGTRRDGGPALATGPSRSTDHCPGEAFRALDRLTGHWRGERVTGGRTEPVELHAYSVMEGSAVVEEWSAGAGETRRESFAIACLEPGRGHWVRYELTSASARFERHEADAPVEGAAWSWSPAPGPGSDGSPGSVRLALESGGHELRRSGSDATTEVWSERLRRVEPEPDEAE